MNCLCSSRDAGPLLKSLLDGYLTEYEQLLATKDILPAERRQRTGDVRQRIEASFQRSEHVPFEIASFAGPVSVNPRGVYEGRSYRLFPCRSEQTRMNSFNVGEFVFPNSYWSLSPLLLVLGDCVFFSLRMAATLQSREKATGSYFRPTVHPKDTALGREMKQPPAGL